MILSGKLERPLTLDGIGATKGARAAIEAAGGKVNAPAVTEQAPAKKPRGKAAKAKKG